MSNITKQIQFSTESRRALLNGVCILARAVRSTLGPKGRHAILQSTKGGAPVITKDGVSVAREVPKLACPFENMGAELILQASNRACEEAGDGTTTTTVLTEAMAVAGVKAVETGINPVDIKRGMDVASREALKILAEMALPCDTEEDIINVATVSANNDQALGSLIANAVTTVGINGIVTVEDGQGFEDTVEFTEGMSFDRGYASPYFANQPDNVTLEVLKASVIVWGDKLTSIRDIKEVLSALIEKEHPIVLIVDDISPECLQVVLTNKMSGACDISVIKAPGMGNDRRNRMRDIAFITGATYKSSEVGDSLSDITMDDVGYVDKLISNMSETTLIVHNFDEEKMAEYVAGIEATISQLKHPQDIEAAHKRIAKLSGGVAVIKVGATSEIEMREKKDRIDDSLSATRCAIESGIVAGGGSALLYVANHMVKPDELTPDERVGWDIFVQSLLTPITGILENAGLPAYKYIIDVENDQGEHGPQMGFNARTNKFTNMIDDGIIDPVKVTQSCVKYSTSVAGMILTTEVAIGFDEPANSGGFFGH